MIALISDIHSNIAALSAVLDDIKARGITRIFFLGDLVGYGPDPLEVAQYLPTFERSIIGNHDEAVLYEIPPSFNPIARRASEWTRKMLDPAMHKQLMAFKTVKAKRELWERFLRLPRMFEHDGMLFFHDTPLEPGSSKYVRSVNDAQKVFKKYPACDVFFIGHSHLPRIFFGDDIIIPDPGRFYPFDQKMIVNVGSIGQPRDRDRRSCYVVLEKTGFRYFRIPYDVEASVKKILAIADLDNFLAQRLLLGK